MQSLKKLLELPYVDEKNYERVCLYLLRMGDYMSDPDDLMVRTILIKILGVISY